MQMKADWGSDPRYYPIADLKRKPDGRFDDGDLATILLDATANPASAFKARGTPWVMKVIEVMGIERQRAWGSCSLNEFRKVSSEYYVFSWFELTLGCSSWV